MDRPRRTPLRSTTATAPAPAPFVGPRQPVNSPAASLPTELLKQIFELSLIGHKKAEEKQAARFAFGQVAAHWRIVADVNRQAVVNSHQAGKLAEAISSDTTLRGKLKYLIVNFEPSSAGRGQRVAELLKAAPNLEVLALHLQPGDQLGRSGEYGQLGKPMYETLQKLPELVDITLKDQLALEPSVLFRLLRSWPKLEHLTLPGVDLEGGSMSSYPTPTHLPSLKSLEVAMGRTGSNRFALRHLINASTRTLQNVKLGEIDTLYFSPWTGAFLFLLPVAPLLQRFELFEHAEIKGRDYLDFLFDKFKAVRILRLGFGGYNPDTLFQRLLKLPHLEFFSLHQSPTTPREIINLITATGATAFVSQAPKLREVHLPRLFFSEYWSPEDVVMLKTASEEAGVKLRAGLE